MDSETVAAVLSVLALAVGLTAAVRFRLKFFGSQQNEPLAVKAGARLMIEGTLVFVAIIGVGSYMLTQGLDLIAAVLLLALCSYFLLMSFSR